MHGVFSLQVRRVLRAKTKSQKKDRTKNPSLASAWPPALSKRAAASVSFQRAADWILGAFIMPEGQLGKLMCSWGISSQQSPSSLALCFSPLAFSGYHLADDRWWVGSGRRDKIPTLTKNGPGQSPRQSLKGDKDLLLRQRQWSAHSAWFGHSKTQPLSTEPRPPILLPKISQELSPYCLGHGPTCCFRSPFDCVVP